MDERQEQQENHCFIKAKKLAHEIVISWLRWIKRVYDWFILSMFFCLVERFLSIADVSKTCPVEFRLEFVDPPIISSE
jgi:hypothetical protein